MLLAAAHSALNPAGGQARSISSLWWLLFYVTAAIYVLVVIFMILAILRRRDRPSNERRVGVVIGGAVALTILILFVFLIGDFLTGQKLYALASAPNQIEIKITGHQWWWEVEYQDAVPSNIVTAANEFHIPVGVPIKLDLQSQDVIHSFWVPSLHGKKDLIPGHPTHLWLQADQPGIYDGQCAEFCGQQHAHMRLQIVAEDPQKFNQWLESQRKPASDPETDVTKRGQEVFLNSTCITCHSIEGTIAHGHVGPNLTHITGKSMIAAGTLPNTSQNRLNWIRNPQAYKPGVIMPQNGMTQDDLNALGAYLETLK